MSAGDHVINNKKVDPKKAKARHGKIFVGGLSTELSDDDIKNFFSQFGNVSIFYLQICRKMQAEDISIMSSFFQIVEVEMPFDKTKNQRKGFCFITFESEQVVNELLKTPKQTINGKAVSFVSLLSDSRTRGTVSHNSEVKCDSSSHRLSRPVNRWT